MLPIPFAFQLLILLTSLMVTQTKPAPADPAAETGLSFMRHLAAGEYKEASAMGDDAFKKAVSGGQLEGAWKSMIQAQGEFRSFGSPTASKLADFNHVLVPCEWSRDRGRAKIVLNTRGKVVGFFWVAAAIKSAGVRPPYLKTELTERAVTVGREPWQLPGMLTLPKSGKLRAGVVLVHGSGPSDRDETIAQSKPFRDLALGLGQRGIAVLRYDKRTYAHKAKLALQNSITVDGEVVDDALDALKVLRSQPELAGVPTYILGHSLGAILAPEIAGKDGKVAGAILLAGPARPFEDIMVDQFTYLTSLTPTPEATKQLEEVRKLMDGIRKHEFKPTQQAMGGPASYWYDLCGRDAEVAVKTAAGLNCAILIVQGGRDYQSTVEDFKLWQSGLAGHGDATFKLFDDLNHFFAAGDAKATPLEYEDELHVDPKVIELVADWCVKPHGSAGPAPASASKAQLPRK